MTNLKDYQCNGCIINDDIRYSWSNGESQECTCKTDILNMLIKDNDGCDDYDIEILNSF